MKAQLYREEAETRGNDIYWSVVGPGHDRAYFTLIPIAGYSGTRLPKHEHPYYAAPFTIYTMGGHDVGTHAYKTKAAAKTALRKWIKKWLSKTTEKIVWTAESTGVHWTGAVDKIEVAKYYFCPEQIGQWDKGFTVWFGGTYYITKFTSPDQARAAVAETFNTWLGHAKASLLAAQ